MSNSSFFPNFAAKMSKLTDINQYIALFDLDGVVMDTETQYTVFWDEQGKRRLNIDNLCSRIKGQTLTQILDKYFRGGDALKEEITTELNEFEHNMCFNYIAGADMFIKDIKKHGVRTALVTSSNDAKIQKVYQAHPDFEGMFNCIITADQFVHSKPNPECFLKGMQLLHTDAAHSIVFEDSFHGLQAGKAAGAYVVGLATTNTADVIKDKADCVIQNFKDKNTAWLKQIILINKK